jgi:hypothetical protein
MTDGSHPAEGEIIFYTSPDGAISYHLQNMCDSGELSREATVKEIMTVQEDGERQVSRRLEYQMPMRMGDFEREAKRIVNKHEGPDE